jgi:hypothetical protein
MEIYMKARTMMLVSALMTGSVAFAQGQPQPVQNNNTARIDSKGAITRQNPTRWISVVFYQSDDGAGGVYQVVFNDSAPSASSCSATPDNSDLTGTVEGLDAHPRQLLVSFRQVSSGSSVVTPVPTAFTLSCASPYNASSM